MEGYVAETLLAQVDDYIDRLFNGPDPVQQATTTAAEEAGLPSISVNANVGKFLYLTAKIAGAKKILEIGTLAGYSGIWLARALPADGRLISVEVDPAHANVARRNFERAGFGNRATIRLGRAVDQLRQLEQEGQGPFDLVFIDADKPSYPAYLEAALRMAHPGTLILADNLVRFGAVLDPVNEQETVQAIKRFNEVLAARPELETTVVMYYKNGLDGISLSRVK